MFSRLVLYFSTLRLDWTLTDITGCVTTDLTMGLPGHWQYQYNVAMTIATILQWQSRGQLHHGHDSHHHLPQIRGKSGRVRQSRGGSTRYTQYCMIYHQFIFYTGCQPRLDFTNQVSAFNMLLFSL